MSEDGFTRNSSSFRLFHDRENLYELLQATHRFEDVQQLLNGLLVDGEDDLCCCFARKLGREVLFDPLKGFEKIALGQIKL